MTCKWEICLNCAYWDMHTDEDVPGKCKRNPPVIIPAIASSNGVWPITQIKDWCGEFKGQEGAEK